MSRRAGFAFEHADSEFSSTNTERLSASISVGRNKRFDINFGKILHLLVPVADNVRNRFPAQLDGFTKMLTTTSPFFPPGRAQFELTRHVLYVSPHRRHQDTPGPALRRLFQNRHCAGADRPASERGFRPKFVQPGALRHCHFEKENARSKAEQRGLVIGSRKHSRSERWTPIVAINRGADQTRARILRQLATLKLSVDRVASLK